MSVQRRDAIIQAARELIALEGVDGVSHRKVAALAKVPLGSMTYHFTGREELIFEVFTRFADEVAARFYTTMQAAQNRDEAVEIIARMVSHGVASNADELVLTHELYALAARDPKYRAVTHAWMAKSRDAFELHFDPDTARFIDALVEGLSMHRALEKVDEGVGAADLTNAGRSTDAEFEALTLEAFRRIVG